MEKYSVVIVDDHPLLRRGVKELLSLDENIDVVGEAGTREEALHLVRMREPDLVVLDLNMRGTSGVEILSELKNEDPSRRIVILTVSDSGDDLVACIRAGADGYFLKDMEPERFLENIKETLCGRFVVDPAMVRYLTEMIREKPRTIEVNPLTDREQDVLALIAQGLTNKMIARQLGISDGTVKGHVKHLLKKLGFNSRVEAAVWASQHEDTKEQPLRVNRTTRS